MGHAGDDEDEDDESEGRLTRHLTAPEVEGDTLTFNQQVEAMRDKLVQYQQLLVENPNMPVVQLLPLLFRLRGKPFTLQDHFPQEPMYRVTGRIPRRQVVRAGRQVAKCCPASTYVNLSTGRPVQLGDLRLGDQVLTLDNDSLRHSTGTVVAKHDNGVRTVYRVTSRMGAQVVMTGNHQLRTLYGYDKLDDLKVGSLIAALRSGGRFSDTPVDRDRIILTAYMLGDGCAPSENFSFTDQPGDAFDEFVAVAARLQQMPISVTNRGDNCRFAKPSRLNRLATWLKEDGLWGIGSSDRFFPPWVFLLSFADTCLFLSRLWATDGSVGWNSSLEPSITYVTTSQLMARQLRGLLTKLGLMSSVKQNETSCNGKRCRDAFLVRVEGWTSWLRFGEIVQPPGKVFTPPLDVFENSNRDTFDALVDGDVVWDEIESIESVGDQQVYDIEVESDHNFIIDGLVSHNSTGLAASGILRAATNPYYGLLTVTPLFEQIRKFSSNYVRPFLVESTVKTILRKPGSDNSVLQRTLANGANMFYNYASDTADRIRGTAVDEVDVDECFRSSTNILTPSGNVHVQHLQVGQPISSFDSYGRLVVDRVVAVVEKGVRQIWRFRLSDGTWLDCTSNEKFWTPSGWAYGFDLMSGLAGGGRRRVFVRGDHGLLARDIVKIESVGNDEVYDVETERHHTLFANGIAVHNCQDFDTGILPVIEACMGASRYKIMRISGTPKSFDNPLQEYWEDSSQGVWMIPCHHLGCGHENICSVQADMLKMIDDTTTLVCAKCGKPVNSRLGFFVHHYPERQLLFAGYHLPQVIFPMHYDNSVGWSVVQETIRNKPKYFLYNECLGEPIDIGLKLLTQAELKAVAILPFTKPRDFDRGRYICSASGVDWGGKGKERTTDKEEFISNTAQAIGGIRADGIIEIPYLWRVPYEADHYAEAQATKNAAVEAGVDWFAHDFGGAGDLRESMVNRLGWPAGRITPFTYAMMSLNKSIVHFTPQGAEGVRSSYTLDKARSILLTCALIKTRRILLPNWEDVESELGDFFSIFEEIATGPRNSDRRLVRKLPRRTDDIVHAVNFVAMALFHATGMWPDVAEAFMQMAGDPETWTHADVR